MTQVSVPVAIGELIDKITILQIKSEQIKDPGKLINIKNELDTLIATCQTARIDIENPLVGELRTVNFKLWNIEDDIRRKELKKEFDKEFIELARSVYVTNDLRFEIKSKINKLYGSALKEEKSYEQYQ